MPNVDINKAEIAALRSLPDFDFVMVLSETSEFDWEQWGRQLLHQACVANGISRKGFKIPRGVDADKFNKWIIADEKMMAERKKNGSAI